MLILDVPYNEKDDAKHLGAKWNPTIKKWYVENKKDYYNFAHWIAPYGNIVVIEELYLIEGVQKCFRCGKETRVIGFGFDKNLSVDSLQALENGNKKDALDDIMLCINQDDIHIVGPIDPIPEALLEFIQNRYNYKIRYSKTTQESGFSNCCDHCDVLQGDFFLYSEVDSPFFIYSEEDVKALKIYKIKLKQDLIINAIYGWASFDNMFKKYGKIVPLDIEIL